jgi:hypothetical protein
MNTIEDNKTFTQEICEMSLLLETVNRCDLQCIEIPQSGVRFDIVSTDAQTNNTTLITETESETTTAQVQPQGPAAQICRNDLKDYPNCHDSLCALIIDLNPGVFCQSVARFEYVKSHQDHDEIVFNIPHHIDLLAGFRLNGISPSQIQKVQVSLENKMGSDLSYNIERGLYFLPSRLTTSKGAVFPALLNFNVKVHFRVTKHLGMKIYSCNHQNSLCGSLHYYYYILDIKIRDKLVSLCEKYSQVFIDRLTQ